MNSIKEEALSLVENLPEDATWDDLMYHIYVREKIEKGMSDVESGNVISHEKVKEKFLKWQK